MKNRENHRRDGRRKNNSERKLSQFGSALFRKAPRGTKGRRLTRNLDDASLLLARVRARNLAHMMRFVLPARERVEVVQS